MPDLTTVLNSLIQAGPLGVAALVILALVAAILGLGYVFHNTRIADLKATSEGHRDDKRQFAEIVQKNTEAMIRNSAAVDNCTEAVRQVGQICQRLMDKA